MTARGWLPCVAAALAPLVAPPARASNPLEYPDAGSAAFSRGGAWLAAASEPIAVHHDPAALPLQASGFSIEQQLGLQRTCFDRRGPDGESTGPNAVSPVLLYARACSARGSFPVTVPALSVVYRASPRLGVGVAVLPPATTGTSLGQFPALAAGVDTRDGSRPLVPGPYRYQQLEQLSTILLPTASVGYEVAPGLRVGAGFIAGLAVIQTSTVGVAQLGGSDALGDHRDDDSLTTLKTRDLFVPGVVLAVHWSPRRSLDVALWGRHLDAIRSSDGTLDVTQRTFGPGGLQPPCTGVPAGESIDFGGCSARQSVPNHFEHAVRRFRYALPPELRWGVRFHLPRPRTEESADGAPRDPLHDDVFDVELDQSLTLNALVRDIQVRFREKDGEGTLVTAPTGVRVPPNADRPTGYRDSLGVRLGGQWNVLRDLLGVRAGAWLETRSQDPRYLTVAPIGATRWGLGGGLVVRRGFLDLSVGYQRLGSAGLDNHGNGQLRAPAAVADRGTFDLDAEPPGVTAAERRQFRTLHAVNGGKVTFDAHVFTLGGTVRF